MKKNISALYFLFITCAFMAQNSGTFFGSNQMLDGGSFASTNKNINSGYTNVKGTPFLFDDFKNDGVIILSSGEKYNIKNININLDKCEFVSEQGKDSLFIFRNVTKAIINSKEYTNIDHTIYEVLVMGDRISFFKKEDKVIKRQVQDKLSPEVVKWKLMEDYYIKVNDDFEQINLRKKEFYKFIEENKLETLKKYIKKNKLSPKKEKDLIKILVYYNSIDKK